MIPANEDTLNKRIEELKRWIENHDCHLSPMDGCECQEWWDELVKLVQIQMDEVRRKYV